MTPKTEKPREFWLDMDCVEGFQIFEEDPDYLPEFKDEVIHVIEYSRVTELEQMVKESEFLAKENPALHQRIGTILNEHDKTKSELTAAQEKIKSLESERNADKRLIADLMSEPKGLQCKYGLAVNKIELLEAENQKLREELDAKRKDGHMVVEHGYRIAAEHEAKKLKTENQTLAAKLKEVEQENLMLEALKRCWIGQFIEETYRLALKGEFDTTSLIKYRADTANNILKEAEKLSKIITKGPL